MEDNLQWKMTSKYWRWKTTWQINILNLSLGDQTKLNMEDDLKILKVEYLSNHWSDLPQILNLS